MWNFEEDVTPEEAVEFAEEGGIEAISKFTANSLNNKGVMLALCEAGFASDVLHCASQNLFSDKEFVKKLIDYNYDYKYGLETIQKKITPVLREEFKESFIFEPPPSAEDLFARKKDLFDQLTNIKTTTKKKCI